MFDLLLGDFRVVGERIPDRSVDLVFTDPPYGKEFLHLWEDLGVFAARVLKPSGVMVVYPSTLYFDVVFDALRKSLKFWTVGGIYMKGNKTGMYHSRVWVAFKPILFFQPQDWVYNFVVEDEQEKGWHPWQQGLETALFYIRLLTPPDGLVVDPFLGGGTTGVAAIQLKRRFIGIEIDERTFELARKRLTLSVLGDVVGGADCPAVQTKLFEEV